MKNPVALAGLLTVAVIAGWSLFSSSAHNRAAAQEVPPEGLVRSHSWKPETVRLLESLPIQEEGRIKPFSTFAGFRMLAFNGKRVHTTLDKHTMGPTEWMLDCLFHPDYAETVPIFRVENDAALDAVELGHEGRGRSDHYAYFELAPARVKLNQLAEQYEHIDAKMRTPVQHQILKLAVHLSSFRALTTDLDWARQDFPVANAPALRDLFGGQETVRLSEVLAHAWDLHKLRLDADPDGADPDGAGGGDSPAAELLAGLDDLTRRVSEATWTSRRLTVFPPPGTQSSRPQWLTILDLTNLAFRSNEPLGSHIEMVGLLEDMARGADDPEAFHAAATKFHEGSTALATSRGEYGVVPLEVTYYRLDFFHWSLLAFVLGFVLVAFSWIWPKSRVLRWGIPSTVVAGLLLVSAGIVVRCVIRSRPPVSTLYETILFITATGVLGFLVTEFINRRRIALAASSVLGSLGMFLAMRYELHEARDTMPNLQAVLDTNFWLATHVTTVTIGYSAGLMASAVAHVYLFRRLWEVVTGRTLDRGVDKGLTRTTYGVLCFGLLFSLVGTILGGIWANDSWGRFWGWDPKENGALMICLWELIILHARMGGYIRDWGMALAAVFGGIVVAFSWWGVNLLGIGLHAYGFLDGVGLALHIFYVSQYAVLAAGGLAWVVHRSRPSAPAPVEPPTLPGAGS